MNEKKVLHREVLSLSWTLGLVLALFLGSPGCGESLEPQEEPRELSGHEVPALRFAGADLTYVLRRLAAEAGLLLVLDEIRPRNITGQDLGFEVVDVDLEGGPIETALEQLKTASAEFDYRIDDGVLLARSTRAISEVTALDVKNLPGGSLETDFKGLTQWITAQAPNAYVAMGQRRGQPIYKKVLLEVPPNSSVMDVLVMFARQVGSGMRIRRAGYALADDPSRVVATTIGMWRPLEEPQPVPRERTQRGIIWALASVAERTDTTICVLDRSVLLDPLGSLNYATKIDRGLPLEEALDAIAWQGDQAEPDYHWAKQNGIIRIRSRSFQYFITGRDLLDEKVRGGSFEGSLAELTRWINANRRSASPKILVGGELLPSDPRAKIEIEEGTRIEDLLYQFAEATGDGWNLVVRDSQTPVQPLIGTWSGAYLSRLAEWGPEGQPPMN